MNRSIFVVTSQILVLRDIREFNLVRYVRTDIKIYRQRFAGRMLRTWLQTNRITLRTGHCKRRVTTSGWISANPKVNTSQCRRQDPRSRRRRYNFVSLATCVRESTLGTVDSKTSPLHLPSEAQGRYSCLCFYFFGNVFNAIVLGSRVRKNVTRPT